MVEFYFLRFLNSKFLWLILALWFCFLKKIAVCPEANYLNKSQIFMITNRNSCYNNHHNYLSHFKLKKRHMLVRFKVTNWIRVEMTYIIVYDKWYSLHKKRIHSYIQVYAIVLYVPCFPSNNHSFIKCTLNWLKKWNLSEIEFHSARRLWFLLTKKFRDACTCSPATKILSNPFLFWSGLIFTFFFFPTQIFHVSMISSHWYSSSWEMIFLFFWICGKPWESLDWLLQSLLWLDSRE